MNYYRFHLGDYARSTLHLSWEEDCAYRRLLDAYYTREKPIHIDEANRLCRAISKKQFLAIKSVLNEFFTFDGTHWNNKAADEQIAAYQALARKNKKNADRRWQPKIVPISPKPDD